MLGLDVAENLAPTALDVFQKGSFLDRRRIQDSALRSIETLRIRPSNPHRTVRLLSGGNQQKVCLGKWLTGARTLQHEGRACLRRRVHLAPPSRGS
jgi:ribose transport system ATP-binding protein